MPEIRKVNLQDKLSLFEEHWSPKVVGDVGDFHVKLAKLEGEFIWHRHEEEDELFLVLKGHLRIELRDGSIELDQGELVVIPRGVEHRPVAREEAHVLLFEPATTLNTGNVEDERTLRDLERI
jgi:mannose-6-phosphate isomerase-like protein (cupin superfamily)